MAEKTPHTSATAAQRTREAYGRYCGLVFHTLRHFQLSEAEVAGLGEDVFFRYFRNCSSLDDECVKPWLVGTARSLASLVGYQGNALASEVKLLAP